MASGTFGAVARYNQRGVGRSSGSRFALSNLRGAEDAADVSEMVDFLATHLGKDSRKRRPQVFLVGYSFGACLAAAAIDHPALAAFIGVSYPLGGLSFLLKTRPAFERVCRARYLSRLLVVGNQDQYTAEAAIAEAVLAGGGVRLADDSSFEPAAGAGAGTEAGKGAAGAPLLLKVFPGNDHFWSTDCALMAEYCLQYCEFVAAAAAAAAPGKEAA